MRRSSNIVGIVCRNCGAPIADDGRSSTGFLHSATERTRCDGQPISTAGRPGPDDRAALA